MDAERRNEPARPHDAPRYALGIDAGKDTHWIRALTAQGEICVDRAVANTPTTIAALLTAVTATAGLGTGPRTWGLDMLGGSAALVLAMLQTAGETVVHVPGRAVNRARSGTRGGENKSDAKDAHVIADLVRTRTDLRVLAPEDDATIALRLLTSRRRDLVTEQTRRLAQLHTLLCAVHPGLERGLDLGTNTPLYLLTRYVTPAEIRAAGREELVRFLRTRPHLQPTHTVTHALAAAAEQPFALPGEAVLATLCRDLASEALRAKERLAVLDTELAAWLARHPDGALVQTLPGMGATMASEFLAGAGPMTRYPSADHLAAAAGIAPVLRQTGRSRFVRRPLGGNKVLKRACYQSAFIAIQRDPASRAYYDRKRAEGKCHRQAILALARRRINVLYAMLRDHRAYTPHPKSQEAPPEVTTRAA